MDAFKRLASEGFIEIIPQVGCRVVTPTRDEISDFFLILAGVEGTAAHTAAQRRTEDELGVMRAIVADVSGRSGAETHPLLVQRDIRTVEIVTVGPDRGLAGGLVTNLNRETSRLSEEAGHPVRIVAIGRKTRNFAIRSRLKLVAEYTGMRDNVGIADGSPSARTEPEDYEAEAAEVVYLVYRQLIRTLR